MCLYKALCLKLLYMQLVLWPNINEMWRQIIYPMSHFLSLTQLQSFALSERETSKALSSTEQTLCTDFFAVPFFCSSTGYMSVMSWRPYRICQVWCSRIQLEWQAIVWLHHRGYCWNVKWLNETEMSVNETFAGGWFVNALTEWEEWRC